MTDIPPTYQQLWRSLLPLYEAGEARAMVRLLMETQFGISLPDLLCYGTRQLDEEQLTRLGAMMRRLQASEPIQYVTHQATFCGRTFHVEPGVLIPRPETEVLCRWVTECPVPHPRSLDIGCGSGCIAVTLSLDMADAQLTAYDISPTALEVTRRNARRLGAQVAVMQRDILAPGPTAPHGAGDGPPFDVIVSNPPYICRHEAATMHPNVWRHEPHEALFVPDSDPLCFYSAIARFAASRLRQGGWLFFECHAAHTMDVARLLSASGFRDITTRDDDFGKTRFVRARAIQEQPEHPDAPNDPE